MDDDARRARDEVVNAVELRPVADREHRRAVPSGLVRRELGLTVAAGVLDLLAAVGVLVAGPDAWFTSAAAIGFGMAGANAIIDAVQEARRRRSEVARIRQHGPDGADTLASLRTDPPRWIAVARVVYELLLFGLLAVVAVAAWDEGPVARGFIAAALVLRLTAAVLRDRYASRKALWMREFLRDEQVTLPPLPDRWRVLAPQQHRSRTP